MACSARPQVLITHPGRQHSHQAALGLHGAGMLAGYWAGVPSLAAHARRVPRRLWSRYTILPLPPDRVRWAPWVPALRRLGDRLPLPLARTIDFRACRLFDRWAAARLARCRPRAVIACEISARTTFEAARRLGITTLLDAPSFHHQTQDRVHATNDPPALHRRINAVKDHELGLADHVLTVSQLARDSYLQAGLPAERVHALALGADLELFQPQGESASRDDGEVVFLFAGAAAHRKGLDLLLAAFARVAAGAPACRLRIAAPLGEAATADRDPRVTVLGPLDQAQLAGELRHASCLVLPSRHDSFGMVVAEALASGTPAIVSEMVGAKDLLTAGVTGWVVPLEDVDALAERMTWCARHSEQLAAMRPACRRSAEHATWAAYHRRLVDLLATLLSVTREATRG